MSRLPRLQATLGAANGQFTVAVRPALKAIATIAGPMGALKNA